MLVLHLFLGHRRGGADFQAHMQTFQVQCPAKLFALSIDIANHPSLGDLSLDPAVLVWLELRRSGRVAGVLAGPPCESWSIARHRPAPDVKTPLAFCAPAST